MPLSRAGVPTPDTRAARGAPPAMDGRQPGMELGACASVHGAWRLCRPRHNRHTTATLLLKAGASLAVVQRILRHSDPAITSEIYGHLDLTDMGAALERLSFAGAPNTLGPPVVRSVENTTNRAARPRETALSNRAVTSNGPSWIRTRDQPVMSRQL
jgi:hypothetical protein